MISRNPPRHARACQPSLKVGSAVRRRKTAPIGRARGAKRVIRRLTISFASLGVALGVSASVATTPANAWPWSSKVTLTGALNQCTNQGIQAAYVNAVFNNQRVAYETKAGMPPSYSVTFTNVPSNGGWAWIVVNCDVIGGSQGHWVKVYRPAIGDTLVVNL